MILSRIRSSAHRADWLALLLLAAWPFIFYYRAALRQVVFYFGDIFLFFFPTHLSYANALHQGRLPLWEPNMLAGFPLFAEGQIGALYPLHPLLYGLLPIDIATNYDILLHIAWVAVGTYLFARTLKLQPPSAFLAAFAFSTGGFFAPRLQHMSVIATASWLPWLLWAWEQHERTLDWRERMRWFALIAVMSGIQLLGGHPQFAFSTALLMGLYGIVRWNRGVELTGPIGDRLGRVIGRWSPARWNVPPRPARIVRWLVEYFAPTRVVPMVCAFVLGAGIAAAQLMPTFELAGFTNRATGLEARFFNAFSLRPIHFALLVDPFLLGNPWPKVSVEVIGYVGLLTLTLAAGAILVRRDRRIVFFVFVALAALSLGTGDQNLIYRAMRHLPLFNYFRVPSRFLFWFTFAAAMLAGFTLDYLLERARITERWTPVQKLTLLVFAVLIAAIVGLVPILPLETWLLVWTWLPLLLALVAAWILLGARRGLFTRTTLAALVVGVTVIDMALFASVYSKTYNATTTVSDFFKPPDSLSALNGLSMQEGRVYTSLWIYPWQSVMRESLYPNIGMIYGVPNAIGYTPLLPQYTSEYLEDLTAPLANLMNVKYYLIPQLLAVSPRTEGDDLYNKFNLNPLDRDVAIPPTPAVKLAVISSLSQSVDYKPGTVVADIHLTTAEGGLITLPLRVGTDTGEWAYERSDVRKVIPYPMPQVATSFPAGSALPIEMHTGHTYRSEFYLSDMAVARTITGIYVYPQIDPGLVHVDQMILVAPDGRELSVAHLANLDDQHLVYRTNDVAIYENPDVLPRAFIVHDASVLDDSEAAEEIFQADFKPADRLILASGEPVHAGTAQRADENVQIVEYKPERLAMTVRANADGFVLLSDTWFPGWVARVDGAQMPIQRADLVFRAVRISPGEHHIEMEYQPESLRNGTIVSVLALLLVGILVLSSYRLTVQTSRRRRTVVI
jgi:hypothetical protein